jgi:GNAT superfamily N-acetyltransferase
LPKLLSVPGKSQNKFGILFYKGDKMGQDSFRLVELNNINDDLLLPWLDLYETAFPANERVLVSLLLGTLKARQRNEVGKEFLLAAVDQERTLTGMIQYEFNESLSTALLWYFAVKPEIRSKGMGSQMFREFCDMLVAGGTHTLMFEIEIPELNESEEERLLAERRINFYRRLGAKILTGIHYLQYVGPHQPPTPMHLMVKPLHPLSAQTAYELAKTVFDDAIEQTGPLSLE